MTAQISHTLFYRGEQYAIVAGRGSIRFRPDDYGLHPTMLSTACWDGYWCDYEVADGALILKNLYVYVGDGAYPPINGVEVHEVELEEVEVWGPGGRRTEQVPRNMGARSYYDVGLPVEVTGKITIGRGFDDRFYRHMGYQVPYAFERVYELSFDHGGLVGETDMSEWAALERENADPCDP